jgi:hypothetical protein
MYPASTSGISEGGMTTATKATQDARAKRSSVTMYSALRSLDDYEYPRLRTMQRRIRLLKLTGGSLDNPEITCKLFEVEFGRDGIVRDPNDIVRDSKDPDENGKGRVVQYEALSWCWGNEGRELGIRMTGMDGNTEVAYRMRPTAWTRTTANGCDRISSDTGTGARAQVPSPPTGPHSLDRRHLHQPRGPRGKKPPGANDGSHL